MYKGTITVATPIEANTNIPFVTELNTNGETSANAGVVTLKTSGYKNLWVNAVITDVPVGDATLQVLANGVPIPEATATVTSGATTDFITVPIQDVLKVLPSNSADATLSVQLSVAATINSAVFVVQKVR